MIEIRNPDEECTRREQERGPHCGHIAYTVSPNTMVKRCCWCAGNWAEPQPAYQVHGPFQFNALPHRSYVPPFQTASG